LEFLTLKQQKINLNMGVILENIMGLETIERKRITALGVKPIG
jgi:hypothetical protein